MNYDYIIIGAGIAGITAAEELTNVLEKKVLLIEKLDHIGGQCYDFVNENGLLIHKYGPHIFHTDDTLVYNYLSMFTRWNNFSYKLLYKDNGNLIPIPFNILSIDKSLPHNATFIKKALLDTYEINDKITVNELRQSDNINIRELGDYLFNLFAMEFKKIYDVNNEEIEELSKIMPPILLSYDCRKYQDVYQVIPSLGYTNMFKKMLNNENITLLLETDYKELINIDYDNKKVYFKNEEFKGHLIFTGLIDEFFNYKYGKLPYRSAIQENETVENIKFQDNSTIYYSNDYHFTKITEYKYLTKQETANTTIQFEYPVKYDENNKEQNIPYYPIPLNKNIKIYEKYKELTKEYDNITFIGRLTNYKNIQIGDIVKEVLELISEKFVNI